MALETDKHPQVRSSAGVPLFGGDIYQASINGVSIPGWFLPTQGGVSVRYSNQLSRHKKDGWIVMVDYDEPMYLITLNCIYSGGVTPGPVKASHTNPGFYIPDFGTYNPNTGGGITDRSRTEIIVGGRWTFSVGDVWRFEISRSQSDRGVASPSRTDFVGVNLLLDPGTSWQQPANGFWQFTMNFANLLGSPVMTGGKNYNFSSEPNIQP